jgi:hypothetical protein
MRPAVGQLGLNPLCTVAPISRPIVQRREYVVRDDLNGFVQGEHASGLSRLEFFRTVCRKPFSDEPFLLLMNGQLGGPILAIPFLLEAKVCPNRRCASAGTSLATP